MKFWKYAPIIFIIVLASAYSKTQSVEYIIKASFIEKFARFTEWEPDVIGDDFVIGVLGESPFYNELEKLSEYTKIKNRSVKILYLKNIEEAKGCQLVFICSSERENITKIIKDLEDKNILLVGDTPGYSEQGVHFNFYFKDKGSLHFEVNIKSLAKAKLKTEMQLLKIARLTN